MRRYTVASLTIGVALMVSSQVFAQSSNASKATVVFENTCAAFVGSVDKLRNYLQSRYQRFSVKEYESKMLDGNAGQVWFTGEERPSDNQAILSYDNGDCAVAATAPAKEASTAFIDFMTKLKNNSSTSVEERNGTTGTDNRDRELVYVLRNGSDAPLEYSLTTTLYEGDQMMRLMIVQVRK